MVRVGDEFFVSSFLSFKKFFSLLFEDFFSFHFLYIFMLSFFFSVHVAIIILLTPHLSSFFPSLSFLSLVFLFSRSHSRVFFHFLSLLANFKFSVHVFNGDLS